MSYFRTLSLGEMPSRPLWLPFLETLASQVDACALPLLLSDATRWANALPRVAKLVEAQVVAVGFIDELGVEAFASMPAQPWSHPSMNALLECVGRLAETVRPARELAVALPGPERLCQALGLETDRAGIERIKPGLVKLLEMVCERRPDLVVLNELIAPDSPVLSGDYRRLVNTLKNVSAYFGVPLGLRISGYRNAVEAIASLSGVKLEHLMLGEAGLDPAAAVAALAGSDWRSLGLPLAGTASAAPPLPQTGIACYWCSAGQESDLELARTTGQALA